MIIRLRQEFRGAKSFRTTPYNPQHVCTTLNLLRATPQAAVVKNMSRRWASPSTLPYSPGATAKSPVKRLTPASPRLRVIRADHSGQRQESSV